MRRILRSTIVSRLPCAHGCCVAHAFSRDIFSRSTRNLVDAGILETQSRIRCEYPRGASSPRDIDVEHVIFADDSLVALIVSFDEIVVVIDVVAEHRIRFSTLEVTLVGGRDEPP